MGKPDAAALRGLVERVEKATGPDRELDAHIAAAVGMPMLFCDFEAGSYHGDCQAPGCGKPLGLNDERRSYPANWEDDERLPSFTDSLDAITALINQSCPEPWAWQNVMHKALHMCGEMDRSSILPIYMCLAFLRALESRT